MTEKQLRQKVVAQARAWLGKKESDGSFRPIIDIYNKIQPLPRGYRMTYTDQWCAAFVSAVGFDVCLSGIIYPECGCGPMVSLYKQHNRWMENDAYVPSPGDIIFYDWDDSGAGDDVGEPDHVGIVEAVNGTVITVIEGNMSDAVGRRRLSVNDRYIRGYGLPDYKSVVINTEIPPEEKTDATTPMVSGIVLPDLRRGDKGEVVRAAQFLLNGRGCSCGKYGADGDFGPATEAAVLAFQRRNNLNPDGIIGSATWAHLLGVTVK